MRWLTGPASGRSRSATHLVHRRRPARQRGRRPRRPVAAFRAIRWVLPRYLDGGLAPTRQRLADGHVFRRAEFGPDAVRQMWNHFESGMMAEYFDNIEARRRAYPIVPVDVAG